MLSMETFVTTIKPSCERFLQNPNKYNIERLTESLNSLENTQLDIYQTYILLPLIVKIEDIKDEGNSEIKTLMLHCISDILTKIRIKNLKAFKTILIVVLKQIHDFEKGNLLQNLSEEIKLAAIDCISTLFQRTNQDVLEEFYANDNRFLMAKVGFTCVELISKEKYRALRISSIQCLSALFFVHDNASFEDIVMRSQVANATFIFLPRIVQTLVEIATGDEKLGESLITISIRTLGRILCLIFEDYEKSYNVLTYSSDDFLKLVEQSAATKDSSNEILFNSSKACGKTQEKIKQLQNESRTETWLRASSSKLVAILRLTSKLRTHELRMVQEEYANMCCLLAEKCFKYLEENFFTFLETIIALSESEDEEIRVKCNECISHLTQNPNSELIFKDSISSLFENHMTLLPGIINRRDPIEQATEFLFLKGFFCILPLEVLRTTFSFQNNIAKFCMCIISALDLKLHRDLLTEEYALRSITDQCECVTSLPWRRFTKISSPKNVKLLQDICNILGKSIAVNVIFDELISLLSENMHIYNEIIIFLIFLLGEQDIDEDSMRINLIYTVLDEILQENHWHLALHPDPMKRVFTDKNTNWHIESTPGLYESAVEIRINDLNLDEDIEDDDCVTISDAQFNVLHTCVILDAIGSFSLCLKKHFEQYVFKSLHKILLKAGSSNCMIYSSAAFALNCIGKSLGFTRIGDLIHNFSDYVSYHINTSIKKMNKSKDAADILNVVLQFSSVQSLLYLENIITTILYECSNCTQTANLVSYLKVFLTFLSHLNQWNKEIIDCADAVAQIDQEEDISAESIYAEWLNILNKENEFENELNTNQEEIPALQENDNEEQPEQLEKSTNEPLPHHIQLVIEILKKISKFVSSKDQSLKILSMECLTCGLPLLKTYEDELLPIVHLIWEPLSQRFKDNDPIVLNRCFTLYNTLATLSEDFLLSRSLKDVIYFMCDFLKNSAANSIRDINLTQTQEFKLQVKLLEELPNIIISMGIQERELDAISDVVILYLNNKQPDKLQQLALHYFKQIFKYNGPLIYVKLVNRKEMEEFTENIKRIFEDVEK